jgi:hypothetical protein
MDSFLTFRRFPAAGCRELQFIIRNRLIGVLLSHFWSGWQEALSVVKPHGFYKKSPSGGLASFWVQTQLEGG